MARLSVAGRWKRVYSRGCRECTGWQYFTGSQKIRLATTMPLDLDATQVLSNSVQTLGKLALTSFPLLLC